MTADEVVPGRRPFLTARWSHLFLANYAVPDELLLKHLPSGLQLDRHDGHAYVSLVAFDFLDTRVLGISWPGFRSFAEVNLRFYVRHGEQRGVSFIREIVPSRVIASLARLIYNEPYVALPLVSRITDLSDSVTIEHTIGAMGRSHIIRATGSKPAIRPADDSVEHFFKEHRWGFGRTRRGATLRYEVVHPVWDVYAVREFQIDVDWAQLYGSEWSILHGRQPNSTVLALGSPVAVYPKGACR